MRRLSLSITTLWILFLGAGTAVAQVTDVEAKDGYDLFQQALVQERVEGDLEAAIERYQRIVENHGDNRPLAATALVQIGQCWEKLGKAEAGKAYEQVLHDYADQLEQVATARNRLALLAELDNTGSPPMMITKRIWTGTGDPLFGSPDRHGRYLTFVDWTTGDLAVRELATGEVRRLTDKGPWSESSEYALESAVSADGRRVVFTWANEQHEYELRTVGIDRSQQQVLYANEEVSYPAPFQWSPDGSQILALFTRQDRTNQIVLVSASDGTVMVVKTLDWRYPVGMSFSPDGRFITYAFSRDKDSEDYDIFALATDGSRERTLVQHPSHDGWPVWTPDGKHVLFTSDRTGTMGVWAVAVADGRPMGTPKLIKPDMGQNRPLGVTAAGSYYFGTGGGMTDVYTAEIDLATGELLNTPVKTVERFTGSNYLPAWSPDGRYLAFVTKRSRLGSFPGTAQSISIRTLEAGEERKFFLDLNITAYPHLRWSPDGGSFLVTGVDKVNRIGVYRIDARSGDTTTIVRQGQLPDLYFGADWSSDGRSVFYSYQDAIYRRELESGVVTKLNDEPVFAPLLAVSPDGEQLAYLGGDASSASYAVISLNIIPVAGGKARILPTESLDNVFLSDLVWTPDGRQLLFTKPADVEARDQDEKDIAQSKIELWRISATGGEAQRTGLAMSRLTNFVVHPDGRRIAFTVAEGGGELWVMENFLAGLSVSR